MNEKFYELPPEKQQRIINAGLEVFGAHDYPQASTDDRLLRLRSPRGYYSITLKIKRNSICFCLITAANSSVRR